MIDGEKKENISSAKIVKATKWSIRAEFSAKMIVPITNMLLARILVPEAFGIVATVNMVVSFADMFATAGFQKYLIQHDFKSEEDLNKSTSVAFWTNLLLSLFLLAIVVIFIKPIALFIGNPGYEATIIVACISLPITAFSSIQEALYRRNLNYKVLFYNRLIAVILPFVVTIPLALLGFEYWALIIGTLSGNLAKAINLSIRSHWKPNSFYSFKLLKEMFSFSMWTMFESFANWATFWIDVLIIGNVLGKYYTGLYRTSQTIVTSIITIITGATTTVLLSSLSRLQNDEGKFSKVFLSFQKIVSIFVLPMGVGMFLYSDLITKILLGNQWSEASEFVGIWGLCAAIVAVYGSLCREAYLAKGKPKLSLVAQLLHLAFVIPICIYSVNQGFEFLTYARSLAYLQVIVIHLIFMKFFIKISPFKMISNTSGTIFSSILMGLFAISLNQLTNNKLSDFITIGLCIVFYFTCLYIIPSYRKTFKDFIKKSFNKQEL